MHVDTVIAASEPWAFTQSGALDSRMAFPKEAKRRGIDVDHTVLRALWRLGLLPPFVEIRQRRARSPLVPAMQEPEWMGPQIGEIRSARDEGRMVDPAHLGYRPQVRFDNRAPEAEPFWWNGFVYVRWQLLELAACQKLIEDGGLSRIKAIPAFYRQIAARTRLRSALLVALEARYMPEVASQRLQVSNAAFDEWFRYRADFRAFDVLTRLGVDPGDLPGVANDLLSGLGRTDPLSGRWGRLVGHASPRAWEELSGSALLALDHRLAAEIVLACFDDIDSPSGSIAPSQTFTLEHRRLRPADSETLDNSLALLGLSPHPRTVLVVEGETEEVLAHLVRDELGISPTPQTMRIVTMRGIHNDIARLIALSSAPLIDKELPKGVLRLARPLTSAVVAVDAEGPYEDPAKVDEVKERVVDELIRVVSAQGYVVSKRSELEELVAIRTWTGGTFELAHFTDAELATAIRRRSTPPKGMDLEGALSRVRARGKDIGSLWSKEKHSWPRAPGKVDLAHELWPTLQQKIRTARSSGGPLPQLAERMAFAFSRAQDRSPALWQMHGSSRPAGR